MKGRDKSKYLYGFLIISIVFLAGIYAGGYFFSETIEKEPRIRTVLLPAGDFNDVQMQMRTSMGNTWRWLCDVHFSAAGNSAECEHTDG